jgi:hypothetical protein
MGGKGIMLFKKGIHHPGQAQHRQYGTGGQGTTTAGSRLAMPAAMGP